MNCFEYENQNSNVYLTYKIDAEETVDSMSLGMISNNSIPGFLDTIYTQMDADRILKYKVTAMITLQKLMSNPIGKKSFISFAESVNDMLVQAEEYMIDLPFIVFDPENIYINISDKRASFVCLPVSERKQNVDVRSFFRNLVMNAQFDQSENCDYVARFMNYFNSITAFSCDDFKNFLDSVKQVSAASQAPAPAPAAAAAAPAAPTPAAPAASATVPSKPAAPAVPAAPATPEAPAAPAMPSKAPAAAKPASAAIPPAPPAPAAEAKKPKFSLFGKKEAKPAPEPKPDKKAEKKAAKAAPAMPAMPGFAVPGQPAPAKPVPAPAPAAPAAAAPAAPAPAMKIPPAASQSAPAPAAAPVVKQSVSYSSSSGNLDFGETVMLDAAVTETGVTQLLCEEEAPKKPLGLIRISTNEEIVITKDDFSLGRDSELSDYRINNPAVGRLHASILKRGESYFVVDQNSRNHTFINGTQIASMAEIQIKPGDELKLANELFKFDYV